MSEDLTAADAPSMRSYLSILWRRRWIILGVTALVFGIGLARSLTQQRVYQAQGTVVLENATQTTDIQTQMRVIETPVVHDLAASRVSNIGSVHTRQDGLGNVITVTADSTDPRRAARTVNATVDAYVEYSGQRGAKQTASATHAIQSRIDTIQKQIDSLSAQLTGGVLPAGSDLAARRDALIAQQSTLQQRLDTLQFDTAAGTGIAVAGRATAPSSPITPNPRADGLIALGTGLLLGIAIAFAVEYLDDSSETSRKLLRQLGAGVTLMGVIPTARSADPEVVSLSAPESETAEAYRSLRSVASSMGLERGRCVEVTSTPGREGKTETLVNLAVLLARSGHRVIVVDCDLREPRVHTFFGLSNEIGLTSVLGGGAPLSESIQRVPSVDHLFVLSSGPVPANPVELLTSPRYSDVLVSLLVGGTLVLVDTPPLLPVTDAAVLAESPLVDAVVLVGTAKASTRKHLRHALDMLRESGAPQVGVVLTTEGTRASENAEQTSERMWQATAHRGENGRQAARPPKSTPIEPDTTLPGPRTKVGSVAAAPDTSSTQVTGGTVRPKNTNSDVPALATINLTDGSTPAEAASVDGAADAANAASTQPLRS